MKRLLFFGATLISGLLQSQINVLECTPENSKITQQEFVGPQAEISKPCVVFDGQNYNFSGNQQKTITAYDEIQIKNNFQAKPTGNGEVHLKADKGDFDVFCMNYPDLLHVLRYKKLELGITIPNEVQEKINNFHNGTEPKINPYLDWDIRVTADFTHPNWPNTISIDGFYNKEFTEWMTPIEEMPDIPPTEHYTDPQYRSLGGYIEQATDKPFLFRFSPPKNGKWTCVVKILLPGQTFESEPFSFTVIESGSPGYLSVSENKRYLELGGESFYPVGCNILWPHSNGIFDPEFEQKHHYVSEEYRAGTHALPRVYDKYKEVLNELIDGGGHYFRTIMYPSSTEIEFEKQGDYTDRLSMAQEMDEILELCENRGALLHWNLQIHYTLCFSEHVYGHSWTWDQTVTDANGFTTPWCYKTLNGMNTPIDFFTNAQAKAYYKQRLRYILARWGYSTNVGLFEILSESNLIVPEITDNDDILFYSEGENWKIFRNWTLEMANFIKSQYNGATHLLTTSFAGDKHKDDDIFYHDVMDVMTSNMYDSKEPSFATYFINETAKRQLNDLSEDCYMRHTIDGNYIRKVKPLIYSETGILEIKCDGINEAQNDFTDEIKMMYQIPFTGLAGGLSWNFWYHKDLYFHLGRIKNAIYNVPDLSTSGWYPGAMSKLNDPVSDYWFYDPLAAGNMDGITNPSGENGGQRDRKADLTYLRSGDKSLATGVVTNKTFNFLSLQSCFDLRYDSLIRLADENSRWEEVNDALMIAHSGFNVWDEKLQLVGMKNYRYYLNYYHPSNLSSPIRSQDLSGPTVRLDCPVFDFVTVFEARKEGQPFQISLQQDSITQIKNSYTERLAINRDTITEITNRFEFKVYPNPTKDYLTIEINPEYIGSDFVLLDLRGKMIQKEKLNNETQIIKTNQLTQGTYIVQISLFSGEIKTFKLDKL
ncbi:MAG: T9SS type A sorting domain-containing protein [Bacteroidota bacterium]